MHSALPRCSSRSPAGRCSSTSSPRRAAVNPIESISSTATAANRMLAAFEGQADLKWAHQSEQLGTGHAVMQAMPADPTTTPCASCGLSAGDVPLVGAERRAPARVRTLANGDLAADSRRFVPDTYRLRPRAGAIRAVT